MSILGTRVVRKEDPALLTRGGIYLADVSDPRLEGAAHVAGLLRTDDLVAAYVIEPPEGETP